LPKRSEKKSARERGARPSWSRHSDEELLDIRLSRLGLRIEGTALEPRVAQLMDELERAGLRFRPSIWLSTDWFSPHGVPGFAIPFYLAHPRLARLERRQMYEVEGGTRDWCMKLLRHEAGHAIDTAYRLHWRRSWRERFGSSSKPYHATYVPQPGSRNHVLNLANWYAQSHPIEDFAESFAVWLRPGSRWRSRYAGWPALRKLEYVDTLMQEVADRPPRVRSRERTDSLPRLRMTLREYYRRKKATYGEEDRSVYDRDLRRLFSDRPAHTRRRRAAAFLRERRGELRQQVTTWTGQHAFVVDEVLKSMMVRCRELGLRVAHGERETGEGAAILVTLHTVRIQRMRHRAYFR
jgi:hypothetical protein